MDAMAGPELEALYRRFVSKYTPEYAEEVSGVPAAKIRELAAMYGDPAKKVVSLWCMGMNQHTRGTWINNLVYNIHLLVGKISTPGNSNRTPALESVAIYRLNDPVTAHGTLADHVGLRPGDIITKLDNQAVTDTASFADIADDLEPGRSVAVLVIRGQSPLFLALRVPD